jgi:Flp pilus assembly protein TadG
MIRSPLRRSAAPADSRGQSLVELALLLPVLLLIVMFALDFGRAFYSWVTITNATRVGANYAASHPDDTYPNADYTAFVQNEALNGTCPVLVNTYNPTFIDGPDAGTSNRDLGDSVRVSVSCDLRILTPIVGSIVGSAATMSASSTFPIRTETE